MFLHEVNILLPAGAASACMQDVCEEISGLCLLLLSYGAEEGTGLVYVSHSLETTER